MSQWLKSITWKGESEKGMEFETPKWKEKKNEINGENWGRRGFVSWMQWTEKRKERIEERCSKIRGQKREWDGEAEMKIQISSNHTHYSNASSIYLWLICLSIQWDWWWKWWYEEIDKERNMFWMKREMIEQKLGCQRVAAGDSQHYNFFLVLVHPPSPEPSSSNTFLHWNAIVKEWGERCSEWGTLKNSVTGVKWSY